MLGQIALMERDIVNYEQIRAHLVVYLAQVGVPAFKEHKFGTYLKAMRSFCAEEVANSQSTLHCWSQFQQVINQIEESQKLE
jgi:hypothetical protein